MAEAQRTISLYIPGQPIAKGRARVTRRGTFTPQRTRIYERLVATIAAAKGPWTMTGPVRVVMVAVFARPKRMTGVRNQLPHDVRPDLDNVVKAVLDGLAAHLDDALVFSLTASKAYGAPDEAPHVSIQLTEEP